MLSGTVDPLITDSPGASTNAPRAEMLASDLSALLETFDVPTIMIGADCKLTRFNQAAAVTLKLTPSDIGRRMCNIQALSDVKDLDRLCNQTITDGVPCRRDLRRGDRWFLLRIVP